MGNLLNSENLSKSLGDRLLWENVTFGVDEGEKIGIIARNGAGKSTLLKVLSGHQEADSGTYTFRKGLRVVYLDQEPEFAPDATISSAAAAYTADLEPERAAECADNLQRLLTQMELPSGDTPVSILSGGQRKRFAVAAVVASEPDFMLLDEPTNHLDINTIEWLENYLRRSRSTLLMVTHDRYFLDRVCNRIIEIDNNTVYSVQGNFAEYLRRREERLEAMAADTARARNLLRREQDWMSRQPQARGGKAKYRIDAYYKLADRARGTAQEKNVSLEARSSRIGSKIFEAEHVSKRFGDKIILDDFTYTFARGEKIGIVGENGVGKSTFVKMLQGIEPIDSGKWDVGQTVRFGYYSQEGIDFDPEIKVIDAVRRIAEDIDLGERRIAPMQYLEKFLFTPADQQKYIAKLSGGERRRLYLATVLMTQPNFLILDEPTNDLDIVTLGILEEYLSDFEGCVIVISHDRYFLDSVADHLFVLEGEGKVRDFPGSYSEYREEVARADSQRKAEATASAKTARPRRERQENKMTFKERKEFESLTSEIESLTAEKQSLEEFFSSGGTEELQEKVSRYAEVKDLLDEKEMRWLELSEKE